MSKNIFLFFLVFSLFFPIRKVAAQSTAYKQLSIEWTSFLNADDNEKNFRMAPLLSRIEETMQVYDTLPQPFLPGWKVAEVPGSSQEIIYTVVSFDIQPARLLFGCFSPGRREEVFLFSHKLIKPFYADSVHISIQPHKESASDYSLTFNSGDEKLLEIPDLDIHILSERLSRTGNDILKKELADSLMVKAEHLMKQPQWFEQSFKGFDKLSTVASADGVLKVITWNVEDNFGKHFFYGVAGIKQNDDIKVFRLIDGRDQIRSPEFSSLSPSKWFGAIYYALISNKYKGNTYYTLLGYNGKDAFSRMRVVDVIKLTSGRTPQFGASIFETGNRKQRRLIFEHSNQATMMLRYDERSKMIVMDHLAPVEPVYQGNRRFYGPDFSVDALEFKKGVWILHEDVDLRNR